jgi:hypothetical protein
MTWDNPTDNWPVTDNFHLSFCNKKLDTKTSSTFFDFSTFRTMSLLQITKTQNITHFINYTIPNRTLHFVSLCPMTSFSRWPACLLLERFGFKISTVLNPVVILLIFQALCMKIDQDYFFRLSCQFPIYKPSTITYYRLRCHL